MEEGVSEEEGELDDENWLRAFDEVKVTESLLMTVSAWDDYIDRELEIETDEYEWYPKKKRTQKPKGPNDKWHGALYLMQFKENEKAKAALIKLGALWDWRYGVNRWYFPENIKYRAFVLPIRMLPVDAFTNYSAVEHLTASACKVSQCMCLRIPLCANVRALMRVCANSSLSRSFSLSLSLCAFVCLMCVFLYV
jgi:hypothetical protein